MDLSDILFYIVLGAISIFSYAIQQKAKRKAEEIKRREQQQAAQEEESDVQKHDPQDYNVIDEKEYEKEYEKHLSPTEVQHELSLEEIFKALRERRAIPVTPPKVSPRVSSATEKPIEKTELTAVAKTMPIISMPEEEGQRAIAEGLAHDAITDENIYNNEHQDNESTTMTDWRQAVIASEILNRKY